MDENTPQHKPSYIPQIGIPEKESFQERTYTRAIYHQATAPGFFGVIILCFFMAFIDIKCNGKLVGSYTGFEIVQGAEDIDDNQENKKPGEKGGRDIIAVRQSAYFQFEKAKESQRWDLPQNDGNDDYKIIFEDDFSGLEDPGPIENSSWKDITRDPVGSRIITIIALLCAIAGLGFSFLNAKRGAVFQILFGFAGFISMMLLQGYVKATIPNSNNDVLDPYYSTPTITVEFAIGYWIALFLFLGVGVVGILKLKYLKQYELSKK